MNEKENEMMIEALIDTIGLTRVLDITAEIAHGKAEHLRTNWQDERSARLWDKWAKAVEKASATINRPT